jgi:uncharacterized protein (DUF2237 family)
VSSQSAPETNVLGEPLQPCSFDPETGYLRDGYCRGLDHDPGRHEICAVVTEDFLGFTARQGNDLATPRPELSFPGLEPGDHWCLCVGRWLEAADADLAPPVVLEATSERVLEDVSLDRLREHAYLDEHRTA